MPLAELTALVVLAEDIDTAGIYEIRVDAQYLLTSNAKPAREKHASCGLHFFDASDNKPRCVVRVTRLWRSHLTAKEVDIGCSTLLDM